ncbi:hypothetical protein ACFRAO_31565 [Streptomyces sp. NPDC056656]
MARPSPRQDQIDAGVRPGTTSEESAELKRLKTPGQHGPGH